MQMYLNNNIIYFIKKILLKSEYYAKIIIKYY